MAFPAYTTSNRTNQQANNLAALDPLIINTTITQAAYYDSYTCIALKTGVQAGLL
jgi:hypothetical protein